MSQDAGLSVCPRMPPPYPLQQAQSVPSFSRCSLSSDCVSYQCWDKSVNKSRKGSCTEGYSAHWGRVRQPPAHILTRCSQQNGCTMRKIRQGLAGPAGQGLCGGDLSAATGRRAWRKDTTGIGTAGQGWALRGPCEHVTEEGLVQPVL